MQKVFAALQKPELQVTIDKYKIYITKIHYLGLIISIKDIYINCKKAEAI